MAPRPRAATGEFVAQNLDLARAPPRLQDGYISKRSEALGRSNGQNGMETCLLLLVACLLLPLLLLLLARVKGTGVYLYIYMRMGLSCCGVWICWLPSLPVRRQGQKQKAVPLT